MVIKHYVSIFFCGGGMVVLNFESYKNIERQRISLFHDLNPKQWQIGHTSDLIKIKVYVFSQSS